jgi:hypothetical protein
MPRPSGMAVIVRSALHVERDFGPIVRSVKFHKLTQFLIFICRPEAFHNRVPMRSIQQRVRFHLDLLWRS